MPVAQGALTCLLVAIVVQEDLHSKGVPGLLESSLVFQEVCSLHASRILPYISHLAVAFGGGKFAVGWSLCNSLPACTLLVSIRYGPRSAQNDWRNFYTETAPDYEIEGKPLQDSCLLLERDLALL